MIPRFGDGRDWFFEKRFGLFLHWGLYAIPAWHEQHLYRLGLTRGEYAKLIHEFDPVRFDPDQWLDLAEEAGMQYVCFTTKHVDGFCLWDTAQTDYNVMNTPYGRDVLAVLADACHRRGFPLCLYYSKVDEHHPNFPNAGGPYELPGPEEGDEPDLGKYKAFVKEQVRELCTDYGEIGGFWWDVQAFEHSDPSFNELIRSLQPNAVLNDRGFSPGDFDTAERDWSKPADELLAFERPMEACQSVGMESWGYKEDEDYYTVPYLIQSLDKVLAKGGNYLLNVGPMADGTIAPKHAAMLRAVGKWYRTVKEAFDGTQPVSHLTDNREVLLTQTGSTLYVHLFRTPRGDRVLLNPIDVLPRKATLLNTGAEVEARVDLVPRFHQQKKAYLRLRNLPVGDLADTVPVVKLEFEEAL
jgi:alpha-L-fucosidase